MMKSVKRIFALLICVIMLASSCLFVNAATVSMSVKNSFSVVSGVSYAKYGVYGSQSGHTENCTVLEFNPNNGYIAMPFIAHAGSANVVATQYSTAVSKYGYSVAGAINGSFFGTANNTLVGMVISNGRVMCTHQDYSGPVVTFDSDGKMKIVDSKLSFDLNLGGKSLGNVIRYVNKRYEVDGYKAGLFYYYDTSCGTVADSSSSGYEILCKKVNNTDLRVGGTLQAEVISVTQNKGPTKFDTVGEESKNFVLYCESSSPYASYVTALSAGDEITISCNETIAASKSVMENAIGAITNVGWLVKDGVDQTLINSTIGTHSVTSTYARWTAFGTKPDGSYVFFTSEGAGTGDSSRSLTLRDVAAAMIKLGCNNVIRMDGGGSSAMYVSNTGGGSAGYVQSASRPVADAILVVKKSSLADAELTAALKTAVAEAKSFIATAPNATISGYISEAEARINSGVVTAGDARRLLQNLSLAGKSGLKTLMDQVAALNFANYPEETLSVIRQEYMEAYQLLNTAGASAEQVKAAYDSLTAAKVNSGKKVISEGKPYSAQGTPHGTYSDNGVRLTDGSRSNPDAGNVKLYSGWNANVAPVITVDLGCVMNSNEYSVYGAYNLYGIASMQSVKVEASVDGTTYKTIGTATIKELGNGAVVSGEQVKLCSFTVKTSAYNQARFIRFTVNPDNFVWIDEIEVAATDVSKLPVVGDAVAFDGFNQYVYANNCFIYTPDLGTLTADKINHRYTTNVILTKTNDQNIYTVKSVVYYGGTDVKNITLASNEIMIAAHYEDSAQAKINTDILSDVKAGDKLQFYGINVPLKYIGIVSYAKIISTGTVPDKPIVPDDPVATESIVVDGNLNDSGWKSNGWTSVTPQNGFWQTLPEKGDTISYKYQFRTDDTKLYGAFEIACDAVAGGNGSGTNVRLWIKSKENVDIYTHLYDVYVGGASGKYNTSTTENLPAAISNSSIKAKLVSSNGKTYVEFSVNLSEFGGNNGFDYYVCVSNTKNENICLFYPSVPAGADEASRINNLPYKNWYESGEATADVNALKLVTVSTGKLGDINNDGSIDQYDYILAKRVHFNTYTPSASEKKRGDVNKDNRNDQYDYILIKRHHFKNYTIVG